MIAYPKNWRDVGVKVSIRQIEDILLTIIKELDCRNLSLSGGVDSSLLLYYMVQVFGPADVRTFTIALNEKHPDYVNSFLIGKHFGVDSEVWVPNRHLEKMGDDFPGDEIVREFYRHIIDRDVRRIIAGDGVDEFMGGYYNHVKNPTEETYYDYIYRLQKEQLRPLNKGSGMVNVLLPYLDKRLISLFSQIPLKEKFDNKERKKIINRMAKGKIPDDIISRRKYGFVDAMIIK